MITLNNNRKKQLVARANELKNRMIDSGIANPEKIKGCSEEEISELEKVCGLSLPYSYKVFLQYFGHGLGGRVMRDVEITYEFIFRIIEEFKEFQSNECKPQFSSNTFFFSTRYGDQYLFFEVDEMVDDPSIFIWTVGNDYFTKVTESIFDILEEEMKLTEIAVSRMKDRK
jgi:hypothetical protein